MSTVAVALRNMFSKTFYQSHLLFLGQFMPILPSTFQSVVLFCVVYSRVSCVTTEPPRSVHKIRWKSLEPFFIISTFYFFQCQLPWILRVGRKKCAGNIYKRTLDIEWERDCVGLRMYYKPTKFIKICSVIFEKIYHNFNGKSKVTKKLGFEIFAWGP